jgi:hypothetical protein
MHFFNRLFAGVMLACLCLGCITACSTSDHYTVITLAPLNNGPSVPATSSNPVVVQTTIAVATTTLPPTAPPITEPTTTTAVPASAPGGTTASVPVAACGDPVGDPAPMARRFDSASGPQINAGLIGRSAEIIDSGCYERVMLTMQPDPSGQSSNVVPGWQVQYGSLQDCSNLGGMVPEIAGTDFLCIDIGVALVTPDNTGLPVDMRDLFPENGKLIAGAAWVGSNQGRSRFVIGVNGQPGFRVRTLTNPYRLMVDVGANNPGEK